MSKLIARDVPVDALPLVDRFLAVRRLSESACAAALAGRPDRAVDAGCQPDQVASGAHHVVLRNLRAAPAAAGLSPVRSGLRVSLQFLLRGGRPASSAAAARDDHAAGRRGDPGLSPARHGRDGASSSASGRGDWAAIVELGLHHEQQHQELILMDVKHMLSMNPLFPVYAPEQRGARPRHDGARLDRLRGRAGRDRSRGAAASPSTTRGRAIAPGSIPSRWRRGW